MELCKLKLNIDSNERPESKWANVYTIFTKLIIYSTDANLHTKTFNFMNLKITVYNYFKSQFKFGQINNNSSVSLSATRLFPPLYACLFFSMYLCKFIYALQDASTSTAGECSTVGWLVWQLLHACKPM